MTSTITTKRPTKSKYERLYKEPEKYIYFNEQDDVLFTIKVRLPDMPGIRTVDGYGKHPKDQMFKPPVIPKKLLALERKGLTIAEIWDFLNANQERYRDEWKFIEREWDRRVNGYWVFINGTPTYIDGWHYFYISYWKIDIGLPEYRSRDRRFFLIHRYAYTTTDAFYPIRIVELKPLAFYGNKREIKRVVKYFNEDKQADNFYKGLGDTENYEIQHGEYIVDMNRRTVFGINYPKHRREGATYKAQGINYLITSFNSNVHGGTQSMDGTSSKKAFLKALIRPWRKVPFFFKPRYDGSTNPKSELVFDIPGIKIGGKGSITTIDVGLESIIDYAETASRQFYDGDKLHYLHNDEVGKTILENVNERWNVQKKCVSQGDGVIIHGLVSNTSTVGEMSEKGGSAFYRLCELSMYDKRNSVGQTTSGLINYFAPAYDGLEGFIDMFGNSIIEDPEESDLWRIPKPVRDADGRLMGSKRFLDSVRTELLLRDDEDSIKEYEEEVRLHPISFSECFITAGSGSGLDLKLITKRIKELQFDTSITRRGNYRWENDIPDTRVIWEDDHINGRWIISMSLNETEANQKTRIRVVDDSGAEKMVWAPLHPGRFTSGGDPYKFRKTEGKRLSNGGGNVFWERDELLDPDTKPFIEWQSYRNVCTYSSRPFDPDDYAEDMLMTCVYWGSMMFPEINISLIWDHFVRRGYDGYLKYTIDPNGNVRKTPGYNMGTKTGQKIMQLHQQYIKRHCMREKHIEILQECKNIKGIEDITNYDLFAAVGGSYLGSETDYKRFDNNNNDDEENEGDVSKWI